MFNLQSLQQMWANAWPIISLLLICSIFSGAIILERWVRLRQVAFNRESVLQKIHKLLADNKAEAAEEYCASINKPVGNVLSLMFQSARHRDTTRESLERLSDRLIRAEHLEFARYITGLGTIGSVAPFVGLFGTVVGIIHAFRAISENAGGGPGVVANGIAEALITTALGLFVAIPAVVAYNLFTRKIEQITEDMQLCAEELVDLIGPDVR